ncbi:Uncharacterised protein [Slackia heliotrinireducens]|uniref:Uncharacterized protein n=1 Tax=Slackia heliotrinireducens (strain ATCC 29202 / DSM 20476 / NCTC 11029 / RHS 1) TaxID=471855 RepID=C7N842_SLAHD|nr:hypothetical protein [Slackia heliotrinireducens]ACV23077.1 hypothetical protein Shel_20660 [Slackia heliotrinireducens DSM 20476]VEH02047.1 Uncharacterised protein [Slackia heliotrinireducens]
MGDRCLWLYSDRGEGFIGCASPEARRGVLGDSSGLDEAGLLDVAVRFVNARTPTELLEPLHRLAWAYPDIRLVAPYEAFDGEVFATLDASALAADWAHADGRRTTRASDRTQARQALQIWDRENVLQGQSPIFEISGLWRPFRPNEADAECISLSDVLKLRSDLLAHMHLLARLYGREAYGEGRYPTSPLMDLDDEQPEGGIRRLYAEVLDAYHAHAPEQAYAFEQVEDALASGCLDESYGMESGGIHFSMVLAQYVRYVFSAFLFSERQVLSAGETIGVSHVPHCLAGALWTTVARGLASRPRKGSLGICEVCGRPFVYGTARQRVCGSGCRSKKSRSGLSGQ